jgi:Protein of unknown function (DUF3606)
MAMADHPSKRDYRDKTRINMKQPYEERFGVSAQALGAAVRAVGTSVKKVEEYLKEKAR